MTANTTIDNNFENIGAFKYEFKKCKENEFVLKGIIELHPGRTEKHTREGSETHDAV